MSFASRMLKRRFDTIGARLTLWGAVVTFATCAAVCAGLYVGVALTLRQEIDRFLEGEVYEFISTANHHTGNDESLQEEVRRELGARTFNDLAFRLYTPDGRLLISSERADTIAPHWKPDPLAARGKLSYDTLTPLQGGPTYRLCSLRTALADGRTCIAQASYSLARMAKSLRTFRDICLAVLVVSVLIAFAVGKFLATRSLRPIRSITADARKIGADQLDRRLPVSGTGDELDQLIVTLNDLLSRIERHVAQLRQFTADASHELRTPLAALRGATEVALSRERSPEGLRRVLEEHIAHFERLQRIAEDLLLLSRLDAGEQILDIGRVDLSTAIAATVDLYRPVADERDIHLSTEELPMVAVTGDSGRIRQVLSNLLDNAVKYTPPGGNVAVQLASHGQQARIRVRDDGVGIAAADLPHVFDRFFRADCARASMNGAGSGLGLSICRSIILAHGGEIHLDSTPGAGTTVTVDLPLAEAGQPQPLNSA